MEFRTEAAGKQMVRVVDGMSRNAPSSEKGFRVYIICNDKAERVYDITTAEWKEIGKTKPEDMRHGAKFILPRSFKSRAVTVSTEGSDRTGDPMQFRIHVMLEDGEFSRVISYHDWKRIAKTI